MVHYQESFFVDEIKTFSKQYQQSSKQYQLVVGLRLFIFITGIATTLYFANLRLLGATLWIGGFFLLILVLLQKKLNQLSYLKSIASLYIEVNQAEIARLALHLDGLDYGLEYLNSEHAYAQDLDIFGKHSLFSLLNRTSTPFGKRRLAQYLLQPTDIASIKQRQQAVKELSEKVVWRQAFEVKGLYHKLQSARKDSSVFARLQARYLSPKIKKEQPSVDAGDSLKALMEWLGEENKQIKQYKILYLLSLIVLPAAFCAFTYLFLDSITANPINIIQFRTSLLLMSLVYLLNTMLLRSLHRSSKQLRRFSSSAVTALEPIQAMMELARKERFESELLQAIGHQLQEDAKDALKKLLVILNYFTRNPTPKDVIFLSDLFWLLKGETLKKKILPAKITIWTQAVGELEALNSLAGYSYGNPSYPYPSLCEEPFVFQAQDLGHPLISPAKRVTNDFTLSGQGSIGLVTGSNMAGKSTFLRTVGINIILALAGAPVCASSLTVSSLSVFTSMRTVDNLSESTSSFLAELKRLKQLLDMLKSRDKHILFLLDEILKGTNSADRHAGSQALIKQLSKSTSMGLVSTHDLNLSSLADKMNLVNYSFNSGLLNDKIIFDYKLTAGPCHTANATALMKQMGIGV